MSKYHATKIKTADGVFDSRKEYNRWCELKLLQRAGRITELERQVTYTLIPTQYLNIGKKRKVIEYPCTYRADFVYKEAGETVVEDCKGYKTPEYIIKRKLLLFFHGIRIRES